MCTAVTAVQDSVEERDLTFEGFAYTCRIVHQGAPRTAPLLLLGGSSQDRYSWQSHEGRLAPLCTLITVDLPGYGSSDFLPARYGIDFLADTVRHMLTEVGVPEVPEFLDEIVASGGHLWACRMSADMMHLRKEDLYDGVEDIINAADFIDKTNGAQLLFI